MMLLRVSMTLMTAILFSFMLVATTAAGGEDAGKELFEKNCVKCHGEDGKGETKIGQLTKTPNLNERPWKRGETLEDLVKLITEGEGKMPKAKKLSADEISVVAAHTLDRFKEN